MKKITLISILLALVITGCNQQKAKTTYFKEQKSGKIYNRNEFNNIKIQLAKRFKPMYNFVQIHEIFTDSIVSHDSIIKTFIINVSILDKKAKPQKEKIYTYLNKRLPSFDLKSINNEEINLSKLKGKPTVLNFWFTTCIPCIEEMPVLNQIMNKYKDEVNFVSVTFETKKSVETFLKTHKFNFIQIAGATEFINKLGIKNFPKNVFIDKNGIVKRIEDGIPSVNKNGKLKAGNGKEFEKYINDLL